MGLWLCYGRSTITRTRTSIIKGAPSGGTSSLDTVLVVDDDASIRDLLAEHLSRAGLTVLTAADGAAGLEHVRKGGLAVVLTDLSMPRLGGMDFLAEILRIDRDLPVIVITGNTELRTAVHAVQAGAYDYLTKPFDRDDLLQTVRRALERQRLRVTVEQLRREQHSSLADRMGRSASIQHVIDEVSRVAGTNVTVLIQGETGTGKELVARAIHEASARRHGAFVPVDCGAIPESLAESELFGYEKGAFTGAERKKAGYFEAARGGTLFLDEVGNLPLAAQAKLLRVLQERELQVVGASRPTSVDVRVVAASNVAFDAEISAGRFRQDLFYRLSEYVITLPPLRKRHEDVADLAARFLAEAAMEFRRPVRGFADDALKVLIGHAWPGNVRELRNVVRRAVLAATDFVEAPHLPLGRHLPSGEDEGTSSVVGGTEPALRSLKDVVATAIHDAECQAIRRALTLARGNKSEAARLLKTNYTTLHLKVKQYGLSL